MTVVRAKRQPKRTLGKTKASSIFSLGNSNMSLPHENAISGANALEEIGKILTRFECARFGTMTDNDAGELPVQFSYRGKDMSAKASYCGYAAAWLKEGYSFDSNYKRSRAALCAE
ncbi:hypothetical protein [Duganella sp. BJB475]|uniref:hypothetical protein n=1 Tax=Duganella sp. BJB475 TaxID=2233914 RepID=UPI0018F5137B|nr:hypothetical protein [Duganella sp. BJB475]